ncbi:hypothetical protein [Pseudanabaena mucicola]|uniref:Uncharacterized protein n=1 Tax=Pseudanabaena mucicola FACHB-723 TaxID=2692860 RepID=A0ABR7ZS94_9CYAN|nr:hypothetical protein [Pseudanabaena mucicola]MBD2186602.1 hypothetical protein [Pseudanabaena mucicola FACHB-723]
MINLFAPQKPPVTAEQSQQVKDWLYEILQIDRTTIISLSQLQCSEPNCPPIQTAIAIMLTPPLIIRIHKATADINYTDVCTAIALKNPTTKKS